MRRKFVTIRDVAARAGVSVSTVSHVLNGNDQHVGAAKRELVLQAVDALHYRPNAIARSMVKQTTTTIGLVLSEVDNPILVPVIAGVEEIVRPSGYHMVLACAPTMEDEVQAIETLRAQRVDGFVFMSLSYCYPFDHLLRLKNEGVPFVVINRCVEDNEIKQVLWDDRGAGYTATSYLLERGHTHIGTISGPLESDPPRRSSLRRHRGWMEALQERGLPVRPEWIVESDYTYEGGYQATKTLLARVESGQPRPSALFVAGDMMAIGTLKALHDAGLHIPRDIAVITIGDPAFGAFTVPALTTIALPVQEAGQVAARLLLDWLTIGKPASLQPVTLSFSLKIRESC